MKKNAIFVLSLLGIVLLIVSSSSADQNNSGAEGYNVTNNGQGEDVRYHGEITKKSGPEIIISENELKPTPATVFYDENRGLISENDFIVGEQVIYSYHPTTMELIYLQKVDKTIPLERKKDISEDEQKKQDTMNKNPIKVTNGVYTN